MIVKRRVRPFVLFLIALIALFLAAQLLGTAETVYSVEKLDAAEQASSSTAAGDSRRTAAGGSASDGAQNVELIGQIGGTTNAVAVRGSYAYVGEGPGLTILDITGPATPTVMSRTSLLPGIVVDVAVAGDYAYVTTGKSGLTIFDVTNPASPIMVGFIDTPGYAYNVDIDGNYAYVADGDGRLRIIDVRDPTAPVESGYYMTNSRAYDVDVVGDYAYVAVDGILQVINISNPAIPFEAGHFNISHVDDAVVVRGNYAYLQGNDELQILDISVPAGIKRIGAYRFDYFNGDSQSSLELAGDYAYVSIGYGGLRIVDVSDPAAPEEVGRYDPLGFDARGVAVAEDNVFVSARSRLSIFSKNDATDPVEIGFYLPITTGRVAVDENTAYVTGAQLYIVDISDPSEPSEVGFHEESAYDVAVAGEYAYTVLGYSGGLRVIDVSNPATPTEVGFIDTPMYAYDVSVAGGYAYIATEGGLRIIDVSDPTEPVEVGAFDSISAKAVAIAGNYAYVAGGGLHIINIENPSAPFELASLRMNAMAVAVVGNHAYVAADAAGLLIVDISNPTEPTVVGQQEFSWYALDVAVAGASAYVGVRELHVVNVVDPTEPVEVGFYKTIGEGFISLAANENYVFVGDGAGGLLILQYTEPIKPPKADFSASPTSAVPPFEVTFTNLSTGAFDECHWDFGDGRTSTDCGSPKRWFEEPGKFTISLTVKGAGGEDTMTRTNYVTVFVPPTAGFSAFPTSGLLPLTVQFTNLSTGSFDECLWDFGDGSTAAVCGSPIRKFRQEGSYTISLTVKGPYGEDTKTIERYIQVGLYRAFLPGVLVTK